MPIKTISLRAQVRQFAQTKLPALYGYIVDLKAARLETLYARVSDHYWGEAQRRGLACDEDAIRAQVLSRPALRGRPPQTWGAVHTFFIDDGGDYTKIHLLPALRRAGQCTVVDWQSIAGATPLGNRRWPGASPQVINGLIAQIERAHRASSVHWILSSTMPGTLSLEALRALAKLQIPLVSYWADDKHAYWQLMGSRPGACPKTPLFDLCWTTASACLPWYLVDGGRAIAMPEGASQDTFHLPRGDAFQHEISFVGYRYGQRTRFMNELARRGISVATFGRGWEHALTWDEMARCFARSRINLGLAGVGPSDRLLCLKGRDFEVPLAGGLYLTRFSAELARHYRISEEILCYGSPEDCVEIIRHLQAHPDECERIRQRGQQRALQDHTWDARLIRLLRYMGLLREAFVAEKPS